MEVISCINELAFNVHIKVRVGLISCDQFWTARPQLRPRDARAGGRAAGEGEGDTVECGGETAGRRKSEDVTSH